MSLSSLSLASRVSEQLADHLEHLELAADVRHLRQHLPSYHRNRFPLEDHVLGGQDRSTAALGYRRAGQYLLLLSETALGSSGRGLEEVREGTSRRMGWNELYVDTAAL